MCEEWHRTQESRGPINLSVVETLIHPTGESPCRSQDSPAPQKALVRQGLRTGAWLGILCSSHPVLSIPIDTQYSQMTASLLLCLSGQEKGGTACGETKPEKFQTRGHRLQRRGRVKCETGNRKMKENLHTEQEECHTSFSHLDPEPENQIYKPEVEDKSVSLRKT